ncbi:MAG: UDP-glucose 4-epimerase GalE [Alphaproteobacteria bacterium]|nr:UDP-glucose 4-epimerase GalE [Alphaproteobacteria bacterium]
MENKKILVLGGAGYIGAHVVSELLKKQYKVLVYDNMSTGQKENLFDKAEFINADILDVSALEKAMDGVDAVIFFAGKKAVGESMLNPELYARNNLVGAVNVLNTMCAKGIKNIIFSSSAAVYGIPQYVPVDEKHPLNPINFYGFTKLETERLLEWYDKLKGIKYAALRYFNAAGYDPDGRVKGREQNPQNLLPIIAEVADGKRKCLQVFGTDYDTPDGTCLRDYIHVNDLATAHVLALEALLDGHDSMTLNLGTGKGVSVKEIVAAAEKFLGRKLPVEYAPRRPGDPAILYAKADRAKQVLGWQPKFVNVDEVVSSFLKKH